MDLSAVAVAQVCKMRNIDDLCVAAHNAETRCLSGNKNRGERIYEFQIKIKECNGDDQNHDTQYR